MDASKGNEVVRISLTRSQSEEIKAVTGRDVEAIEFTVHELEERIAPFFRLAGNCNETLLVD
jgi:hypothetical protein